jgi:hypothetical protein
MVPVTVGAYIRHMTITRHDITVPDYCDSQLSRLEALVHEWTAVRAVRRATPFGDRRDALTRAEGWAAEDIAGAVALLLGAPVPSRAAGRRAARTSDRRTVQLLTWARA